MVDYEIWTKGKIQFLNISLFQLATIPSSCNLYFWKRWDSVIYHIMQSTVDYKIIFLGWTDWTIKIIFKQKIVVLIQYFSSIFRLDYIQVSPTDVVVGLVVICYGGRFTSFFLVFRYKYRQKCIGERRRVTAVELH